MILFIKDGIVRSQWYLYAGRHTLAALIRQERGRTIVLRRESSVNDSGNYTRVTVILLGGVRRLEQCA